MTIQDSVLQGSFRGIRFDMTSGATSGGPKIVKHTYPNSDRQTLEPLGLIPRVYSVNILVGGGDNYLTVRDQIIRALENTIPGKLTHPLYGDIENVIALPYTLNENFNALGQGSISVVFEVSEGTGVPDRVLNTFSLVEDSHSKTLASIGSGFVAGYMVDINQPSSYSDALSKGQSIGDSFTSASELVQGATDQINSFSNEVAAFQNDITSLINTPQAFSDSIQGLFTRMGNLYPTAEATLNALTGLFGFGDSDAQINQTTYARTLQVGNRAAVNAAMKTTALSYAYLNTARIDFLTVEEINSSVSVLETQYKFILDNSGLNSDTKNFLSELRLNAQAFFEAEKLTAQQLVTVRTPLTSARLLAYKYYGSSENGEQIANINSLSDPAFIEGDVELLST